MAASTSVDDYLAALPAGSRAALDALRATISAAAPGAVETISYQMPAFRADGRMLVWYAAFKRHCSLYPASRVVVDALGADLAPYVAGKGTIRFPLDRPIPVDLVTRIIEVRLQEIASDTAR
jgi:uncharacterized protein YdhG (YjbR/CyaY superfamily)